MRNHRTWGILLFLSIFLSFFLSIAGCQLPSVVKPTISTSNEILEFDTRKNIIHRFPGLPGIPTDLVFLPNGQALAVFYDAGLAILDLEKGVIKLNFGPTRCVDVEILSGKTINNLQPFYATVDERDEAALFLDEKGNPIGVLPVPKGSRSIHYLDNGNFLIANGLLNKILEIDPTGKTIWESTVELKNPYDTIFTPQETFLIADFDNHRVIEINRQNELLNDARGFNHPRRIQLLPDGNILVADSDLRRIVALSKPANLSPIITDLNRPVSLAFDPVRQILLVGIEPFFAITADDYLHHPSLDQIQYYLIGLVGSLLIVAFIVLGKRYSLTLHTGWKFWIAKYRDWIDWHNQSLLAIGILLCALGSGFLALQWFPWGLGTAGIGVLFVILSRSRIPLSGLETTPSADWDAEGMEDEKSFIQRPYLLMIGLLLFWWSFLISHFQPLQFWPILPWFIAPWFCAWSLTKRLREPMNPTDPFWLILILGVAIFFRFYRIHEIPYGLWIDETYALVDALREYANKSLSPFSTTTLVYKGSFDIPNLYLVALLAASKTIGASFLLVKGFSLLPSLGIVVGVYYLGKWAWGSWAGRCGALLLAMSSWQSIFARWGWLQQWYVCFAILALAFFIRAYRWKCPRSAAYAGIFLGFGFYTYIPILLTLATIILLYLISFLEPARRQHGKLMFICGFHLILVFAPLWLYYIYTPGVFTSRANAVGMRQEIVQSNSLQPLQNSIAKYGAMLHVQGDFNPRHNFPNKPLLDPCTGGLFLAGLALLVWRFYRPAERAILLALSIALMGGILSLSVEAPNSFRTGVFGPLVYLTAGLPLASLIEQRRRFLEEWQRSQGWVITFTIFVFLSVAGWNYYRLFIQFPSEETWPATFGAVQHRIYNELTPNDLGSDRLYVHPQFISETFNLYTFFLEVEKAGPRQANLNNLRYTAVDLKTQIPDLKAETTLFIMPCGYEGLMKEKFPAIEIKTLNNPRGIPQAVMGRVTKI